jgi:ribosomal protein RSM22 (predicted rRNA methylase)
LANIRTGQVIPFVAGSDKHQLHNDAKRLFQTHSDEGEGDWQAHYDIKYRSWQQRDRHKIRDGTAFASIALPAHYSAIFAVLYHVKRRLGPDWNVERVVDWGAGTGSALW